MTFQVVQIVRLLRTCIYVPGGKLIHPANLLVIQAKNTLYPITFCCLTFIVYYSSDCGRTVNSSLRLAGVTSLRTYDKRKLFEMFTLLSCSISLKYFVKFIIYTDKFNLGSRATICLTEESLAIDRLKIVSFAHHLRLCSLCKRSMYRNI